MRKADLTLVAATLLGAAILLTGAAGGSTPPKPMDKVLPDGDITEGSLIRVDPYSKHTGELCPLKHTDVNAAISGSLARVTLTQEFENTTADKIEAVYTFPLPRMAAVDDMTMRIGDRFIRAQIKKREEARRIYEQARDRGQVASLLEQQRPNIFTQSVTNIEPGAKVQIVISYVETLKYDEGAYEFSFPMTVGPRYNPASMGQREARAVTPKYAPAATRAGHDVSLKVRLDAGVAIDSFASSTHEITTDRHSAHEAVVALKQSSVIPNKDFVLRYDVAGAKIQDALLTHSAQRGGFFSLIVQPPQRVTEEDVTPKELVFVLDTSGSMSGFPIEKAKETMRLALAGLYPRDTFNLITFAGDTHVLFPSPVPATPENMRQAQRFLAGTHGSGGTEMMRAIRTALSPSGDPEKVRIVCFMTDGYVGNEAEILNEIRKNSNARIFSFGIGSSVNRYLLDKMAELGRGEVEYVALNDDGSAAARRFHERVRNPLLTDVTIDWHGLPVAEVYPNRIPDLFSAKPVIVNGRYTGPAAGTITLHGRMSGRPFSRDIQVNLPARQPDHDVLATLWARTKIEDLMHQNPQNPDVNEVTRLGLEYRLVTQYTSFVAVEEKTVTRDGKPVRIDVPVEMPEGVSHEGVFGARADEARMFAPPGAAQSVSVQAGRGFAGGVVGGIIGSRKTASMPPPPPPPTRLPTNSPGPADATRQGADTSKLDPRLFSAEVKEKAIAGKIAVEIWLTEATPQVLAQLKQLGFEEIGTARVAKIRTGRISLDKLQELSRLDAVLNVRAVTR
ncbi:VIT and VWA domain-containing protein [uncultured Paludibaculum sp.]|uniref:VIT and vWA domain-containing protein n=1 Tax=uncultured Paludibaculum sp. TaxID=1765020 RepID=UPI002AAB6F77|nr:VIT and VWA domain-containing protein [uncultured Paludibaculum sp.]